MPSLRDRAKNLVLDTYRDSFDFYQPIRSKFPEIRKIANGEPLKKKKKFNRFVPYIPAAIDLILPRIMGRLPIFDVKGRTPDDDPNASVMDSTVKYFLAVAQFNKFELEVGREMIIYGTVVTQDGWDLTPRSKHPDDPRPAEPVDRPDYKIIPIENVFPHRNKVDMQDEWPIVIREEVSRRDLERDPNIDSKMLKNIGEPVNDEEFFSQRNNQATSQDTKVNSTKEKSNDIFVKLTYYGNFNLDGDGDRNCFITVVNFDQVVRLEANPFWHQEIPLSKLNYTPDAHNFFTPGMVEQCKDLQLELNEIRNTRSAARAIALKTPLIVDRNANVNLQTAKWEHSAVWLADFSTNPDPIRPMSIQSKLLELDREENAVKGDLQVRSGINDVVIGQNDVGVAGGKTATGAAIAAEQTSLRFKTQAILIDQFITEIGNRTIRNIQQFVDRDLAYRIVGDEGFEWRQYDPETMTQFDFDFIVTPMSTVVTPKAAKREALVQLKGLYAQDMRINHDKLDRMIFDAYDIDPNRVIKTQKEQERDQAAVETQTLADEINSPDFAQRTPQDQQLLQRQLQAARQSLEGGQNA